MSICLCIYLGLNNVPSLYKINIHEEYGNMILFGNRISVDVIARVQVKWIRKDAESNEWCQMKTCTQEECCVMTEMEIGLLCV